MDVSREVITRASEGDIASFEIIFQAYADYVFTIVLRIVQSREDAEDITQEVFLVIYRKLKTFRFRSGFRTWVYRVAVNLAINRAKKLSKTQNRLVTGNDVIASMQSKSAADENVEKEHAEGILNALLIKLTPEQRTCIVLRNIEGLSYNEISQVLRISINAVRSRLKRAREKLMTLRKEVVSDEM